MTIPAEDHGTDYDQGYADGVAAERGRVVAALLAKARDLEASQATAALVVQAATSAATAHACRSAAIELREGLL